MAAGAQFVHQLRQVARAAAFAHRAPGHVDVLGAGFLQREANELAAPWMPGQ